MTTRSWIRNLFASRKSRTLRKTPARCRLTVEALEDRIVLSPIPVTNYEQLMIELLNRGRAAPLAEAARAGIDLNEGLAPGTISPVPKQPLAPNASLLTAMRAHIQDMIDRSYFGHVTPAGHPTLPAGAGPSERAAAAGYTTTVGENLSWAGVSSTVTTEAVYHHHVSWFVDAGVPGRGHRLNMMSPSFKEIGPGLIGGLYRPFGPGGTEFEATVAGQLPGFRPGNSFLTGVIYNPNITPADNFYTPGEGLGGVTISAVGPGGTFTETTGSAGGYFLQLAPGTYTVTASGGSLGAPITRTITIGSLNVKQDFAPGATLPAAPTGVMASDGVTSHPDYVRVTWNAVAGATGYEVWRNTTNDPATATPIAWTGPVTSYDDTTAMATTTSGTTYFYWVKARTAADVSAFSPSDSGFRPAITLPAAPTGVTASDATFTDRVQVTWNASLGARSYEVWRNTTNSSATATRIAQNVMTTSYDDTTAVAGTTYFYWVKASNEAGVSGFSASDSGLRAIVIPAPTGVAASDGTFPDWVRVTWNAVAGATSYEVWRNNFPDGGGATLIASSVGTTSFDDTTPEPFTLYFYSVRVRTATGYSDFSPWNDGFRPSSSLSAPTGVAASDATFTDRVQVTWNASAGATLYEVWRNTTNNPATATRIAPSVATTSYDDTTAVPGTTYFYWVRADSATSGVSGFSASDTGSRGLGGGAGQLQLSAATSSVNENGGSVTITVTRTGGTTGAVAIQYATSNGSAVAPGDYTATSGTLNFTAGQTSATFSVPIVQDALVEGNEMFNVTLSSPTGGATLGSPTSAVVTIVDDDVAIPGTFQFSAATYSGTEAAPSNAVVTITRTANNVPASVTIMSANGTATAPADFTAVNQVVNFTAGQTSATVTIAIVNDALVEGSENFTVALSNPTGGAALGSPITATVTIVDDDAVTPGTFTLNMASYTVTEGGTVAVIIQRTANNVAASVTISTTNGSAVAPGDYTAVNQVVNFTAGQTSATVNIATVDDALVEGAENFTVALSNATAGAALGTPSSAPVTINDNDVPIPGTFQFSAGTYSVNENGGTATITVTRSAPTNVAASVTYATSNGSATAGADYTAASGTLNFAAGQTSTTFIVPITNDTAVEGNETVNLTLSAPTGGAILSSPSSAVLTIVDDDAPSTASISGAKFSDLNNNGVRDAGEPGLPGWTIYLDQNTNGMRDPLTETFSSTNVPVSIIDQGTVFSSLVVPGSVSTITDVDLNFYITHTFVGDLDIYLISPNGTRILLVDTVGGGGQNFGNATTDTILDDQATTPLSAGSAPFLGRFRPSNPLSAFNGQVGGGTWRLEIQDTAASDVGTLMRWSLTLTHSSEPSVQTDIYGNYTFANLPAGTHTVREVPQAGWSQTAPAGGAHSVMLAAGQQVSGRDFGNRLQASTLQVTSLVPTPSGFIATFNQALDSALLNLYDAQSGTLGAADLTLIGATTGPVRGSLVVAPGGASITFVRTGDVMPADAYTLTLRSAANAFRAGSGLLDGNADGTPGGDYTNSFTIVPSSAVVVRIPDIARGPGQAVNVPATGSGLPIILSNGAGVTSVSMTLLSDPRLLAITGAVLPAGLPAGASVSVNTSTAGSAILTFTSPTALSAGEVTLAQLTAVVLSGAPYGAQHTLDLTTLQINGGAIAARDNDGVHLVNYLGDTTANAALSSADATLVQRVAVGLDIGFRRTPLTDPVVVADVTNNGAINSTDATRILQEATGIDQALIPPLPHVNFGSGFAGSAGLTLNGSTQLSGGALRLTNGGEQQAGSAFTSTRVSSGRFAASFSFRLTDAVADGFAFVLQGIGATALGENGGGLGYSTIGSSVAVKFDLFNNAGEGNNTTGLYTNGAHPSVPATDLTPSGIDLHSGRVFNVAMNYDGTTLRVTIIDSVSNASATQSHTVNIPALVGNDLAFVGFTGGTGGLTAVQDILNWTFTSM